MGSDTIVTPDPEGFLSMLLDCNSKQFGSDHDIRGQARIALAILKAENDAQAERIRRNGCNGIFAGDRTGRTGCELGCRVLPGWGCAGGISAAGPDRFFGPGAKRTDQAIRACRQTNALSIGQDHRLRPTAAQAVRTHNGTQN